MDIIMNTTRYHRIRLHKLECLICAMPYTYRKFFNECSLNGYSFDKVWNFIKKGDLYVPYAMSTLKDSYVAHNIYLSFLLEDIYHKNMYSSIKKKLKDEQEVEKIKHKLNFSMDLITKEKKIQIIDTIERALLDDPDDDKKESQSIYSCLVKTTIPLLIEQLNRAVMEDRKARDVKDLSSSLNMALTTIKDLSVNLKPDNETINDLNNLDFIDHKTINKDNVVSLSDKIKKAVNGGEL